MSKKVFIQDAIVGLETSNLKDIASQLNVVLANDAKALEYFRRSPNEFLADRGLNVDSRREFLKDAGIRDTSAKFSFCLKTCWCTDCCITSISITNSSK